MVANFLSHQQSEQDISLLKKVWESIDFHSCPGFYNFHMHTTFSDGKLTPSALIEQAIGIGLQGFAITDHHSIGGFQEAQIYLSQILHDRDLARIPHLWTGVEVTSNLQGTEVHILGYGFEPQHPSIQSYLQGSRPEGQAANAAAVIESIHRSGGLAVLAHPARYHRPAEELIPLAVNFGIDGVEAYYAYRNTDPWQPSSRQTQEVIQQASLYNLYTTCGTDSHGLSLIKRI